MSKKITIVNRHYPPNINITGENAWDLANYLINKHGIDVSVVHIDRHYEGGGNRRVPVGNVYPIKTIYQGKKKILSYLSGFLDGYWLIKKARKLDHGPIIVMTSPPLLPMWASMLLGKRNRNWILWSMDLFPEGYAATNVIGYNNPLYKFIIKQTYKNAPKKLIALGPKQRDVLHKKYAKEIDSVVLPCGVFVDQHKTNETPGWKAYPEKIYLGYAGNCGTPHSPAFIKAVIDAIDPETQHMVIAIYGTKAEEIKAYANNKKGITLLNSIPRNELHHVDIHLVTLLETWTHIAVPSKAVSSVCSGATILFCGSKESDNWHLLSRAGWLIEENDQMKNNVVNTLKSITQQDIETKKQNSHTISVELSELITKSYDTIASWAE
ncbi:MAG: hypothetical protein J0L87_07890 [Bacteroidetes bacterium]|nr:hypothetical protein [Bacteroidota bacterium]